MLFFGLHHIFDVLPIAWAQVCLVLCLLMFITSIAIRIDKADMKVGWKRVG